MLKEEFVRSVEPLCIPDNEKDKIFPKEMINSLVSLYPNSRKWLHNKVIPNIESGKRRVIYITDNYDRELIKGCVIIKDTPEEKKICTIWVNHNCKDQYEEIVRSLVGLAINRLKVDMPLVTVSSRCKYFDTLYRIFTDYGFIVMDIKENYYVKGDKEYCYNGVLE